MLLLAGVQAQHGLGQGGVGVVEVRVGEEQGRVWKAEGVSDGQRRWHVPRLMPVRSQTQGCGTRTRSHPCRACCDDDTMQTITTRQRGSLHSVWKPAGGELCARGGAWAPSGEGRGGARRRVEGGGRQHSRRKGGQGQIQEVGGTRGADGVEGAVGVEATKVNRSQTGPWGGGGAGEHR